MTHNLIDLDELAGTVSDPYVKQYINEAILSYRAGANRAAIILSWIAVCTDIIEKIKTLSLSGDAQAKALEARIEGVIQTGNKEQMLKLERELLDIACNNLEFISPLEKRHLERLKEDRHMCAHPSLEPGGKQFSPSPELTRSHISQACNYLLTQPATQGKAVIQKIVTLITEDSFPKEPEQAFNFLNSDSYLRRSKDSVIRNITLVLLKTIFQEGSIKRPLCHKIGAALHALLKLNPKTYKQTLRDKLNGLLSDIGDARFLRVFILLKYDVLPWSYLEPSVQTRLKNLIETIPADDLVKFEVVNSTHFSSLEKSLRERLDVMEYQEKMQILKSDPSQILKDTVIDIFIQSGSFAGASTNGEKYLLPHAKYFDNEDLRKILDGARENNQPRGINQILNAGGIDEIFKSLYNNTKQNCSEHLEIWTNFWNLVERYQYELLKSQLIEDGLLRAEEVEAEEVGDDPTDF